MVLGLFEVEVVGVVIFVFFGVGPLLNASSSPLTHAWPYFVLSKHHNLQHDLRKIGWFETTTLSFYKKAVMYFSLAKHGHH